MTESELIFKNKIDVNFLKMVNLAKKITSINISLRTQYSMCFICQSVSFRYLHKRCHICMHRFIDETL